MKTRNEIKEELKGYASNGGGVVSVYDPDQRCFIPLATIPAGPRIDSSSRINGRKAAAKHLEYDGITDTFQGWAKRTGIPAHKISARIIHGWTVGEALGFIPHLDRRGTHKRL